jgi:uncharacterized small protein (DUF1192 family)
MGPGTLEELRRITRRQLDEIAPNKITSRSLSTLPVDELLPRLAQLQNELRAVAYEIWMRAKPTGTEGSGN